MECPYCRQMDSRVVDSRVATGGAAIWRRRECDSCAKRFTTYERVEQTLPVVIKKSGQREPFERRKILKSLTIACNKRPVSIEVLEQEAASIERELSELGEREVPSLLVGERVMARLKALDGVAYVRFASVYKSFRDIDEFMVEMSQLVRGSSPE
jgi:transcriptional repressor NrdR